MIHYAAIENSFMVEEEPPVLETITYEGVPMLVQAVGREFQVVQLLTMNLAHYLDPRFQPGNRLAFPHETKE